VGEHRRVEALGDRRCELRHLVCHHACLAGNPDGVCDAHVAGFLELGAARRPDREVVIRSQIEGTATVGGQGNEFGLRIRLRDRDSYIQWVKYFVSSACNASNDRLISNSIFVHICT